MPAKSCHVCGSTSLETDHSAGNIVCLGCFAIVESGILVSEVGFSEGAGGRVHVSGAFVSSYSTGISGFRGRGGQESSENVKKQGHERIKMVAEQMGIPGAISRPAQRFFSLAVDVKFNRGRRSEYIVASCLYLQCRYANSDKMLIDFSERLAINVFELGATYLKLRSVLHLKDPMPEVDPAIYNIRFAHRLDFGAGQVNLIAADATRLVRRFRTDWMTQGRRPAGVCGACMIIAARMSGFLRTPDEVAQVVKVSPITIRRRLIEFAKTQVAAKTVEEWRNLAEHELDEINPAEEPPIIREKREKEQREAERARLERLRRAQDGDEQEGEEQDEEHEQDGEQTEVEEERPKKKRRKGKGVVKSRVDQPETSATDFNGALQAVAQEFGDVDEEEAGDEEEGEDEDLPAMERGDYISDLQAARDNPDQVAKDNARDSKSFKRQMRAFSAAVTAEIDDSMLDEINSQIDEEEGAEGDAGSEKEEGLKEIGEDEEAGAEAEGEGEGTRANRDKKKKPFDAWDDEDATLMYLGNRYFADEAELLKLTPRELRQRVRGWIATREPQEVVREIEAVDMARKDRDRLAKAKPESEFADLDDQELESYYVLAEDEVRLRARLWLSHNGRWLEEEKERQEKKEAYNRAHGIDPTKQKPKRKRKNPQKGPFPSAREAMDTFASQKKFSSRINYGVLESLGLAKEEVSQLQTFDDEKDDEEGAFYENEKYDDKDDEGGEEWDE